MMAWISAHQALLLILWPSVTALLSIIYKLFDQNTRAHAFFSFLAAIGVDIPKVIDALGRLFGGGGGGATTNGGAKKSVGEHPTPPTNFFARKTAELMLVLSFCSAGVACSLLQNLPPDTPSDVTGAFDCVLQAVLAAQPVAPCIEKYGPKLVADALQALMDSPSFAAAHPDKIEHVKAQAAFARAKLSVP
jgi:hypothetical protein